MGKDLQAVTVTTRDKWRKVEASASLLTLALSAVALGVAPWMLPKSYDWLTNTTSESAAQGTAGAWLARLGFLLFGLGVIWIVRLAGAGWSVTGRLLHIVFGVLMLAVATFSHKPWEAGLPYDKTEDLLHSIAATGMGFAFALAVASIAFQRGFSKPPPLLDVLAIAAAVLLPLAMSFLPNATGLLQRLMFLIAYLWFANETLDATRVPPHRWRGVST